MSVFLLTRSLQRADHGLLTDIAEGGLPEVIGSLSVAGDKSQYHSLTPEKGEVKAHACAIAFHEKAGRSQVDS
jgi:hypothetical protein